MILVIGTVAKGLILWVLLGMAALIGFLAGGLCWLARDADRGPHSSNEESRIEN